MEKAFLIFMIVLGCALRLIWPEDMEWKGDEQRNYDIAAQSAQKGEWVSVGIPNSQGIPNPPLTSWIFTLFAKTTSSPIGLVRWVQFSNVFAILFFILVFLKLFTGDLRLLFIRGMALFSVSPMPIIYSRKIWQQCLLPFFSFFLILPLTFPEKLWAYFISGMCFMFGIQIHQSGMFFYPFIILFMGWNFRRKLNGKNTTAFILGICAGLLPMIPWIQHVIQNHVSFSSFKSDYEFWFFEYAFRDIFGLGLNYLLQGEAYHRFFGSTPVFILSSIQLVLAVIAGVLTLKWIKEIRTQSGIGMCLGASMLLYGLTLFILRIRFYPHYLIILYPLLHLGIVGIFGKSRWLANTLIVSNAILSILFLWFIHSSGGFPGTEYGVTYHQSTGLD